MQRCRQNEVLVVLLLVVGPRREKRSKVDEPEFREQLVPLLNHQHHTEHQSPTKIEFFTWLRRAVGCFYEALIKRFDVCRQSNYNRIHKSRGVFGVSMPCLDLISFTFCYCFCTGNPLMPHKTTEWPLKRPIATPPPHPQSGKGLKRCKTSSFQQTKDGKVHNRKHCDRLYNLDSFWG